MAEKTSERRVICECGLDITGTDDGTGLPFCPDCDEGKDDEHCTLEGAVPMPERQRGEVPVAAVEAALRAEPIDDPTGDMTGREREVRGELEAACDPALGDQRLVPLADVVLALRAMADFIPDGYGVEFLDAAEFLARTFGGEPDER